MQENPGAYNEARNRIREKQEQEKMVVEKKKEEFEMSKEKVYTKKKLDVFELKRRIETGRSLSLLKEDMRQALEQGDISIDTYHKALDAIQEEQILEEKDLDQYFIPPDSLPLSQNALARYLEKQKLGENIFVDIAGFAYGFTQGSVFLLFLLGRMVLDFLLLPRDIYEFLKQ
ncbi:MAG: hypothetical protein PHY14_04315 [Candidatus Gracilibacteria bacterium]|nr:hypothetical protein [Candidatus Gracilibacteria bacterium]